MYIIENKYMHVYAYIYIYILTRPHTCMDVYMCMYTYFKILCTMHLHVAHDTASDKIQLLMYRCVHA